MNLVTMFSAQDVNNDENLAETMRQSIRSHAWPCESIIEKLNDTVRILICDNFKIFTNSFKALSLRHLMLYCPNTATALDHLLTRPWFKPSPSHHKAYDASSLESYWLLMWKCGSQFILRQNVSCLHFYFTQITCLYFI